MISKLPITTTGAELLSGPSLENFTPDGGFSWGGNHHVMDEEELHLEIVKIFQAIVHRKITATDYIGALLAHAKRYPGLAQFVLQIEESAIGSARKIDDALDAGKLLPQPPMNKLQSQRAATSDAFLCAEPSPSSCKL